MSKSIYQANVTFNTSTTPSSCPSYGASYSGNVTIGGTGGGGIYVLPAGTGTSTSYAWNGIGTSSWADTNQKKLTVTGDAEFEGNIHMNGRNLTDVLSHIESRLAILRPNPALEEEYNSLKELGDQYRELERKLMEKQRTFDILKKQ